MGFPFDATSWEGISGPIFMGLGGSMPGVYSVIGILLCIAILVVAQSAESAHYAKHK